MTIIEALLQWGKDVFLPLGDIGLFIVAFAESSVFPIPPDILLIPLVIFNPALAPYYAAISSIGSVSGGIAGYFIGLKGGRPLATRLFSEKRVRRVERYFEKYGAWAVLIAGFSPIPYKIFTIASGIVKLDLKKFIIASAIGRGSRFFAEAIIIMVWGEQIINLLMQNFEIISLLISAVIVGIVVLRRRLRVKLA